MYCFLILLPLCRPVLPLRVAALRLRLFPGRGHKSRREIYAAFVCSRCQSSVYSLGMSCLQQRVGLAYISQGDVLELARTSTHHPDLQRRATGCALPQLYSSAHARHYPCQRLSVCAQFSLFRSLAGQSLREGEKPNVCLYLLHTR